MKVYTVYKTTNVINNKIYYGFHSIDDSKIIRFDRGHGSCFVDGYLGSGKLIKRAMVRYGKLSFYQEIVGIFDSKEEAESLEASLANKEFVQRDDNYNIALGGNVRIFVGVNNPFYGKHHSDETKKRINAARKLSNLPTYQVTITNTLTGEIYKGYAEVIASFGFNTNNKNINNKVRSFIYEKCYIGEIIINNHELQTHAIKTHSEKIAYAESKNHRQQEFSKMISDRFRGIKQSDSQVSARVASRKRWIENNKDQHKINMDKINKNPEKIRKTAEKHRGMKRTEEAKQRISESKIGCVSGTKGKTTIWHHVTEEIRYIPVGDPCPEGWIFGKPKEKNSRGKAYNNGIVVKLFKDSDVIPDGWIIGALPKPRKKNNKQND